VAARSDRRPLHKPLTVWLKLDTGMHRVGLHPKDYHNAYQRLLASGKVSRIVLMSHFARADELDATATEQQAVFAARQGLSAECSLRNSPAVLGWPSIRATGCARASCCTAPRRSKEQAQAARLQPVMTLQSKVISVRELPAGEPVGYGAKFISPRPMRVGVVAMGYADGYPRQAPTGTPVLVAGNAPADRPGVDGHALHRPHRGAEATVGSPVELWGKQVLASDVALQAGPFPTRSSATCACHGSIRRIRRRSGQAAGRCVVNTERHCHHNVHTSPPDPSWRPSFGRR
jgi:alanine racemase